MKEPMIRLDGSNNSVYIYGIKIASIEDWTDVKEKITKVQTRNTKLEQALNEIEEYIYKNSIPIDLLSNPPQHRFKFEGNINVILQIIDKYKKEDN